MRFFALTLLTALAVPSFSSEVFDNMCTTIGVGPGATAIGASMVTHTADCDDCDFRLTKTPPKTWEVPSLRPVYRYHRQYPRLVVEERGDTWKKENLETEFKDLYGSKKFVEDQLVGYVPQVEKTFGLFEALFAMMNDQNVAIGESTCASAMGKNAVPRECPDCPGPLVDVAAISLIALERCDTARCAVEMMGSLATEYGYYGASTEEGDAGEALTVSDPNEVWMMHLSPDDTGMSAIWVAQRIPHNHVTAAANAFVIRGVDPDNEDMLFSDNIWEVAERSGRAKYDTARAPGLLDFALTFSPDEYAPGMMKKPEYSTDRVWRVFTQLAPSKGFKRTNDWLGDNLPLSVEVEKKVTVEDIMALNRDHYEGSEMDLTKGFAAGPFGSPIRYDPGYGPPGQIGTDDPKDNENGLTKWDRMHGAFPRAIGIMRTSWHFVATSRPNLPNEVAGVMWYSQYQPSAGAYAPLYSSMEKVPKMYARGSLYEYSEESSFWKFCTVGNYAQLAWKYIYPVVKAKQQELEEGFFKAQKEIDEKAVKLVNEGKKDEAVKLLTEFSVGCGETIHDEWGKLLHYLFAKFHDGYTNIIEESTFRAVEFFYPRWWLVLSDYFTNVVNDHFYELPEKGGFDTLDNVFEEKKSWVLEQLGMGASVEGGQEGAGGAGFSTFLVGSVGIVCGVAGYFAGNRRVRGGYTQIADASGVDVRV